ncbi:hypothetical protein Pmani_011768 [Petrolisthes manimaculis]|uniref:Uncharacterized protein n=1 Tax=Petrolisthes manimaculis TaxID=1843537 RepID=A0AAE1UFU4_9EUCA|nr:hypothetical protein Pmani_011768 [Petrolisthes manimaculis]
MTVHMFPFISSQSLQLSTTGSGLSSLTLPLFSPSKQDQWTAASSSTQTVVAKPPPDQVARSSYRSADTAQQLNKIPGMSPFDPLPYNLTSSPSYHTDSTQKSFLGDMYGKNLTSRFFSMNTGSYGNTQTLDLGLSFTVPFLSIPTSSLVNIGDQLSGVTASALASFMDINWPSVFFIGIAILGAAFLLPQVASLLTELTSGIGGGGSTYGTTSSYGRNMERAGNMMAVTPLTSILTQLDDALAQYDLDSTSCMQRVVCSYVASSENSVNDGSADSTQMIVAGLARSGVIALLGRNTITEATEMGRSGTDCQLQYPKCPFSLTGVLKFLASYATLAAS